MSMQKMEAIRCTLPNCHCDCFCPGKQHVRTCETCKHGWVAHALDKLGYRSVYQLGMPVEVVQPNIVFDVASLLLYGAHATPVRLKILLDRLFSVLQHEEVIQVLRGFGWTYEDYARGYILQDANGHVHDKWVVTPRDEEQVILQQFLRFGETKAIAHEIILQDARDNRDRPPLTMPTPPTPKTESEIRRFLERSQPAVTSVTPVTRSAPFETRHFLRPMPYLHTGGSTGGRLLSPSTLSGFAASPAALLGSPLSRMQTMQPFDYRRERLSPASSTASDKSLPPRVSPQNLSATMPASPPVTVSPPAKISIDEHPVIKVEHSPVMAEQSNDGVLNFSIKDNPVVAPSPAVSPTNVSDRQMEAASVASSIYADLKVKHLRKSANPIKRHWQPSPGFGSTLVSASGKKRVLCSACNKSFCDKGALKIHYSAVHLKEMHKCTVDSCNMMFSSRRSRNRHSANPNPKLHMMQSRRRLPDGATIVDDGSITEEPTSEQPINMALPAVAVSSSDPLLIQRMIPMSAAEGSPAKITPSVEDVPAMMMSVIGNMAAPTPHDGLVTTAIQQQQHQQQQRMPLYLDPLGGMPLASLLMAPSLLPPPPLVSSKDGHNLAWNQKREEKKNEEIGDDQRDEVDDGTVERPANDMHRNSRKRKSLMPTRCAQTEEVFVMSDDNSNDGHESNGSHVAEKKATTDNIADTEPEDLTKPVKRENVADSENKNAALTESPDKKRRLSEEEKAEFSLKQVDGLQSQPRDSDSDCSNTPKHVSDGGHSLINGTAPANGSTTPLQSEMSEEDEDRAVIGGIIEEGEYHAGSPLGSESDGGGENPRRCPQCGKMFQNHFGVKTHFQNVHLKLMHTCVVAGCNAAFPSKRSRDRHSSNLNLHRKLLSTSSPVINSVTNEGDDVLNQSLRDEFLPCIYDGQHLHDKGDNDSRGDGTTTPPDTSACNGQQSPSRSIQTAVDSPMDFSNSTDACQIAATTDNSADETGGTAESVGCHLCKLSFRDNLALKEHCEKTHPRDTYRCSVRGCEKIFSTRKSRKRHSQNENLHRHLNAVSPPSHSPDRLQANGSGIAIS